MSEFIMGLKKAMSVGYVDLETMKKIHAAGIEAIELSTSYKNYFEVHNFPENAEKFAADAKEAGIELWSIHLPFSRDLDISNFNDEWRNTTIEGNKKLIEAAGRIGMKVAVLHPSSEPISDEDRPRRLARSREAIIILAKCAKEAGMELAVENLPRTCLCRVAEEMIELVKGTGAKVVYDTNHCLIQNNFYYINTIAAAGLDIISLHISDYDFVNERHVLPGGWARWTDDKGVEHFDQGYNNWTSIFAALEKAGYKGPMMYEVGTRAYSSFEQVSENMDKVKSGEIY